VVCGRQIVAETRVDGERRLAGSTDDSLKRHRLHSCLTAMACSSKTMNSLTISGRDGRFSQRRRFAFRAAADLPRPRLTVGLAVSLPEPFATMNEIGSSSASNESRRSGNNWIKVFASFSSSRNRASAPFFASPRMCDERFAMPQSYMKRVISTRGHGRPEHPQLLERPHAWPVVRTSAANPRSGSRVSARGSVAQPPSRRSRARRARRCRPTGRGGSC
jgi:hypothetical protein